MTNQEAIKVLTISKIRSKGTLSAAIDVAIKAIKAAEEKEEESNARI